MAKWLIDQAHSEVHFKIKHLVISTVTGAFNKFEGEVESEKDDFSDAKITFSASVDSIDTNDEQRDGHLKSADFFDAATYPEIKFTSTEMENKSGSDYTVKGDLTMKGVTKSVELDVDFGGIVKDPYGRTKAGFDLKGKVDRQDFGLTWSGLTEAGGLVVSHDVKLEASIQVIKQA